MTMTNHEKSTCPQALDGCSQEVDNVAFNMASGPGPTTTPGLWPGSGSGSVEPFLYHGTKNEEASKDRQDGMHDTASQFREYIKHNVDFQMRLDSLRASRALLERSQRLRQERVNHLAFEYKQLIWQLKQAQEDAQEAQERNLKIFQMDFGDLASEECKAITTGDQVGTVDCPSVTHAQPSDSAQQLRGECQPGGTKYQSEIESTGSEFSEVKNCSAHKTASPLQRRLPSPDDDTETDDIACRIPQPTREGQLEQEGADCGPQPSANGHGAELCQIPQLQASTAPPMATATAAATLLVPPKMESSTGPKEAKMLKLAHGPISRFCSVRDDGELPSCEPGERDQRNARSTVGTADGRIESPRVAQLILNCQESRFQLRAATLGVTSQTMHSSSRNTLHQEAAASTSDKTLELNPVFGAVHSSAEGGKHAVNLRAAAQGIAAKDDLSPGAKVGKENPSPSPQALTVSLNCPDGDGRVGGHEEARLKASDNSHLPVSMMPSEPPLEAAAAGLHGEFPHELSADASPQCASGVAEAAAAAAGKTAIEFENWSKESRQFLKIEKNAFLFDQFAGRQHLHSSSAELTVASYNCNTFQPTVPVTSETAAEGAARGALEKGSASTEVMFQPQRPTEENAVVEEKRQHLRSWRSAEKLAVLSTITNTMFLWGEERSKQRNQFGDWPRAEIVLSALLAAKDGQRELFSFIEALEDDISRPITCCAAVWELIKAYPPGKLLPQKFIAAFWGSCQRQRGEDEDPDGNSNTNESKKLPPLLPEKQFTFAQLVMATDDPDDTKFWQMLVHYAICVKDHGLASLRQIAGVFVEALTQDLDAETESASTSTEHVLVRSTGDLLRQGLIEFLVDGFASGPSRGSNLDSQEGQENFKQDLEQTASKRRPVSAEFGESSLSGSLEFNLKANNMVGDRKCHSGGSDHTTRDRDRHGELATQRVGRRAGALIRRHSSTPPSRTSRRKAGFLPSIGSILRTHFRIWRLRTLTSGVDVVDDAHVNVSAVVCPLSPQRDARRNHAV